MQLLSVVCRALELEPHAARDLDLLRLALHAHKQSQMLHIYLKQAREENTESGVRPPWVQVLRLTRPAQERAALRAQERVHGVKRHAHVRHRQPQPLRRGDAFQYDRQALGAQECHPGGHCHRRAVQFHIALDAWLVTEQHREQLQPARLYHHQ